eukprot:m.146362 g.146362  ORF g.146362 m.146362 type:complete len:807 (-) comp16238_c0_seq2:319-2739(-)
MQSIVFAALVAVASASTLRPPSFTGVDDDCNFLPTRLPMFAKPPPRPEYLCEGVSCPRAPSDCWYDSQCSDGFCLAHMEKPFGTYCDDGDRNTFNDICLGNGQCAGESFTCPPNPTRQLTSRSDNVRVSWMEPKAMFGKVEFTYSSNYRSGDAFYQGTTEVVYTAVGTDNTGGRVELTCNFYVRVESACDDGCCDLADGTYSSGARPVDMFAPRDFDTFEATFNAPATFTCLNEKSVCASPRKFLPARMPMPPPIAPKVGELPAPTTTTRRTTTTTTSTTTTTTTSRETSCDVVDVVFVLDTSGSVGQSNFNLAQQFVASAASLLDVGSNQVRVAAVTFNFEATLEFDFDDHMTSSRVQSAVNNIAYPVGESYGTATGNALDFIRNEVLRTSNGWRSGNTVVYFITDGVSQETPATVQTAATALLNSGVEVVAIGITDLVDDAQLAVIAGSTNDVITVDDFDQLDDAVRDDLVRRVCPDVSTTRTPDRVTDTDVTDMCVGRSTSFDSAECFCEPEIDNCHTCGWAFDAPITRSCSVCKNSALLHNGVCVESCPAGFRDAGVGGRFSRECEAIPDTPSNVTCNGRSTSDDSSSCRCDDVMDDCHTCGWANSRATPGTCSICKNGAKLFNGECVESCPTGFVATGASTANFYRTCVAVAAADTCVGKKTANSNEDCWCGGDCHTCEWSPNAQAGTCSLCKNEAALMDGQCLDVCPTGFTMTNLGSRFGRECVANRRRSLQGLEAVAANTASATEASSPLFIVGGVLIAFGLVVMAVVSGRKYLGTSPDAILPTVDSNEVQPLAHVNTQ